jgi:hypothetical protein
MEGINTIRIDKNLAYNILDFKKIEDHQTRTLLKSLLLYFSFQYEKDLFGYGNLDPVLFAKLFNYDRSNLSRKIDNPKYLSFDENSSSTWGTHLENALYILATTPIFEEYKGQDHNFKIVGIKNYVILNELYKYTPIAKNKGKEKKYYKYVLDKNFENNLKKFFLNINLKLFLEAKKWNGDDFYLYMMNIISQSKTNKTTAFYWQIDELQEYFNVQHKEIRVVKQRLNKILKKYEILLKDEIKGLSFYWGKTGNQKYDYTVYLTWDAEEAKDIAEKRKITLEQLFLDTLKRNLSEEFLKEGSKKTEMEDFYNWLVRKNNSEIIIEVYKRVKSELDKSSKWGSETWAQTFYNKIKVVKDMEVMNSCFVAK